MTTPLAQLRKLAEQATPGPWRHYNGKLRSRFPSVINEVKGPPDTPPIVNWGGFDTCDTPRPQLKANAAYIAAADPTTVLRLLDAIEELERELKQVQDDMITRLGA